MSYEIDLVEHGCGFLFPHGATLNTRRRKAAKPAGTVSLFESAKGRYIDEGFSTEDAEQMARKFAGGQ